jgi:Carboxypeptidase regulatory-like domain/TonB dependent receptor
VSPLPVDPNRISESVGHRRITVRVRCHRIAYLFAFAMSLVFPLTAQSPNGTINGRVLDPSNKVIGGADLLVINDATGVKYSGKTNEDGIYVVPNLPPGPYRLQVSKVGFKTLIKPDIVLNIQDALSINFTLPVGAVFETVTVEGGASMINTTDASVSTVVDQSYIKNMPLNGRSLQDLILLTPGIVTNNPQSSVSIGESGEFSVNGQRTEANYYVVDGVSANVGATPVAAVTSAGVSGSVPASTALGTTQGLVSVDALQEFRVESSTYSAEYGRNPGGQFSFVTRSGTSQWHGEGFDYLRNDVFDANDWFNGYFGQPVPRERQNDFGGTFGGPVRMPGIYLGKDKTFFFFSYEGLRLVQPQAASVTYVPDANLRASTPAPLQQVLNGFPMPTPNAPNLGNGFAEFIGTSSIPSQIDSINFRLDRTVSDKLRLFFRFGEASSSLVSQDSMVASLLDSTAYTIRTYTFGATSSFRDHLNNEFRLNFSSNNSEYSQIPGDFGGASAVNLNQLQGFNGGASPSPSVEVGLLFGIGTPDFHFATIAQQVSTSQQRQWNAVDALTILLGRHQVKFGVDFRRLDPIVHAPSPVAVYRYFDSTAVQTNTVSSAFAVSTGASFPIYTNLSVFAQDEWRPSSRITLSMGLRWEVNPAPGAANGNLPYTVQGNSLSTLSLAPQGTPLWNTSWFNLAPRLGIAYVLRNTSGHETVVRGGGGVFFDTGQQLGSYGYEGPGFSAYNFALSGAFPFPVTEVSPAIVNPPVAPYTSSTIFAFPSHLQLPFTLQRSASIEQGLGKSQALTVTYVGASGRRLLQFNEVDASAFNPNFGTIIFARNGVTSDYDALQVQVQRRLSRGLQVLGSYTWSHAIDYGSQNASLPYLRGNSDYDVRQNFSSALSYDLPSIFRGQLAQGLLGNWGVDQRFTARTGFPVTLSGSPITDPATGQIVYSGLNLVAGQPVYIYGEQCASVYNNGLECPGGRAINPNAFNVPAGCTPFSCPPGAVGDAPRNYARGTGAWQMDLAVRRDFPIFERLKLQFRAEAFNVFNHPNFGTINATYCSPAAGLGCTFGQAKMTLAKSLGGLSSLYQMGGARSMQFALKLIF